MTDWILFCLACDHFYKTGFEVPSDPKQFADFISTMKAYPDLWNPFQEKIDIWNKVKVD